MEKLLEYDLEEAHFYLYKADLYLKLPVTDINKGETMVNLDKYVEVLKENNIPFTQDQYEEAKKNLDK